MGNHTRSFCRITFPLCTGGGFCKADLQIVKFSPGPFIAGNYASPSYSKNISFQKTGTQLFPPVISLGGKTPCVSHTIPVQRGCHRRPTALNVKVHSRARTSGAKRNKHASAERCNLDLSNELERDGKSLPKQTSVHSKHQSVRFYSQHLTASLGNTV